MSDVAQHEGGRFKAGQKRREIFRLFRLDPQQHGSKISGRLLQIFEACNVIIRAKKREKLPQGAGPLRQTQNEVFLYAFKAHRALFDLWQALKVKVAARCDADHSATSNLIPEIFQSVDRQRSGRLKNDAFHVQHLKHCAADTILWRGKNMGRFCRSQRFEGQIPEPRHGCPVDKTIDLRERHRLSGSDRCSKAFSAFRFDVAQSRPGRSLGKIAGQPGREPAPAHRHDHKIRGLAELIHDLSRNRRLALNDIRIIKGRQKERALTGAEGLGRGEGLIKVIARQNNLDIAAAEHARLINLLLRRGDRHEDRTLHTEMTAGIGHPLRMVARAGTDETAHFRTGRADFAHRVKGTAKLIAAHRRQILAFNPDISTISLRKQIVTLQRRNLKEITKCGHGVTDSGGKSGHQRTLNTGRMAPLYTFEEGKARKICTDGPGGAITPVEGGLQCLPGGENGANRNSASWSGRYLMTAPKKVVLAYSGGLDTSIILKWLQTEYGCEVVTFTADLGQGEELEPARQKALLLGIKEENIHIIDLREEFVRDFVFPMFRANAVYEGQYLLGTSIARPLISKYLVELAQKSGADAVAHGATGKGNDQVRFELGVAALDPAIKTIAPWRLWDLTSRTKLLEFAEANQIPIAKDKRGEAPFSVDANLLHTSSEGRVLENPADEFPEYVLQRVVPVEQAPDEAEMVEITFEKGDAVAINGEAMSPATILTKLNELGGKHGVGVLDLVENRFVGMKSRGVYETPGGTILLEAHRGIEQITLDSGAGHLKDSIMPRYAELIYNGFWFSPEREALQALIDKTQEHVSGTVRVKLYKGSARTVARWSEHSLYSEKHVTFEEDAGAYDQRDAAGFIHLNALRLKLIATRNARVAKKD